jgi:putative NADPH-quinone reductase
MPKGPALLKGLIDRTFLPGVAFKFQPGKLMADPLLLGRSAHLLVTMDTPPWYYRWVYRQPGHQQMKRTILEFCGIRPVTVSSFGPVKSATARQRAAWLAQAHRSGTRV